MRLLNTKLQFCDYNDKLPPYAILSHTWSEKNEEEVTYQDLKDGTTKSLLKLELCKQWTEAANLEYFWIDTCCIDKRNDAEINYAIRSMWRWYFEAYVCFVYLPDLSKTRKLDTDWRDTLKDCRWFTRGWTLQELVASKRVEFHARDGHLGNREDLLFALKNITGINLGDPMPDQATRLGWVANRTTKRPEDKAYCMLGICDVSLDPRYGEGGESAWQRLQAAIIHRHGTSSLQVRGAATNLDYRATVLEALRFDALETRRKTIKDHLAKTCNWILSHPACAKWMKLEHKFFWIKGKPGAGKSVLIRYLDQYITRQLKKSRAIGLYFYFNACGTQLEKSFLGLYRSLLVQLVDLVPELAHKLDTLNTDFDLPQLQSVLASAIRGLGTQIWLFIDALDECREGDVQELIDFLDKLYETELYVCFASRHYPIVKVPTELQLVLEEVDAHKQDLSIYVERLGLVGEELTQIQDDIVAKANGIFLWVVLVMGILQRDVKRERFHAIQSRLREIPEGLLALFKTIIRRDDEHKEEFLLCLRWIIYAQRPLTLKEWYFAMMSGVDGRLEWVEGITDHRMETFLLSSSKGLAELKKGKTITVQFIHESVRDFLVHQGGLEEIYSERDSLESTSHDELKHCCLRGMAFDLPRQVEQRKSKKQLLTQEALSSLRAKYPFAEYATTHILHHANQAAAGIRQQHFLTNKFAISDWLSRYNAFQNSKRNVYADVPSWSYLCAERDLVRLVTQPMNALSVDERQRYRTPLIAAITHASWEVLRVFFNDMNVPNIEETIMEVRSKVTLVLSPTPLLSIPWAWAIANGLSHLSRHLLTSVSKEEFDVHRGYHANLLQATSERGDMELVQLLLDRVHDQESLTLAPSSQAEPSKQSTFTSSAPGLTYSYTGSSDHDDPDTSDAESIRTDNEHHNLTTDQKLTYSDIFVSELKNGLEDMLYSRSCDYHARSRMSEALPDLLKVYALLLARRAHPGFEKQTIIFIRHKRAGIARSFGDAVHAMPTQAGIPELHDKIDLLFNISSPNDLFDDTTDDLLLANLGMDLDNNDSCTLETKIDQGDDEREAPEITETHAIHQARAFMIDGGNDFQWLLSRTRAAARSMTTGTAEAHIRYKLIEIIGSNSELMLTLDWDPVNFLREQYFATECRLHEVICLCGVADNVQALSCQDYTSKMWSEVGVELLHFLSDRVSVGFGTYRGETSVVIT